MTKYEKLQRMKDNFIQAANKACAKDMKKFWKEKADEIQQEMDLLTVEEAQEKIK